MIINVYSLRIWHLRSCLMQSSTTTNSNNNNNPPNPQQNNSPLNTHGAKCRAFGILYEFEFYNIFKTLLPPHPSSVFFIHYPPITIWFSLCYSLIHSFSPSLPLSFKQQLVDRLFRVHTQKEKKTKIPQLIGFLCILFLCLVHNTKHLHSMTAFQIDKKEKSRKSAVGSEQMAAGGIYAVTASLYESPPRNFHNFCACAEEIR